MKFRLPRKTKKFLNKELYLYPPDKDGFSLSGDPGRSQKDYNAYKRNELRLLFVSTRKSRREYREKLFSEVSMSNEELKVAVFTIFAKPFQKISYDILIKAKEHKKAKKYYYGFVNAYNLTQTGDDYANTCCMNVDSAKKEMK